MHIDHKALSIIYRTGAVSLIVFLGIALSGLAVVAQTQGGQLRGTVVAVTPDRKQRLPNVSVTLTNTATQRSVESITDDEGSYFFGELVAGDYLLKVAAPGFRKFEQKVSIQIEAVVDQDILLSPSGPQEDVTVVSDPDAAARTESSVAGQVTTKTLTNAPLINEKFQDALPLLPGVVRGPDGFLNLKGSRVTRAAYLFPA